MAKQTYKKPDYYARRAKERGYAARSVFKLEDIDSRQKLLRKGMRVLDLGAAPGSWMQYAAIKVGGRGRVVGVDINSVERGLSDRESFIQADVFELEPERIKNDFGLFDLVLSDLAPRTTGQKDTDHFRSIELAERALSIAQMVLEPGGNLLVKVFQGRDFNELIKKFRNNFRKVITLKPKGSRPSSREMFILGLAVIVKEG